MIDTCGKLVGIMSPLLSFLLLEFSYARGGPVRDSIGWEAASLLITRIALYFRLAISSCKRQGFLRSKMPFIKFKTKGAHMRIASSDEPRMLCPPAPGPLSPILLAAVSLKILQMAPATTALCCAISEYTTDHKKLPNSVSRAMRAFGAL